MKILTEDQRMRWINAYRLKDLAAMLQVIDECTEIKTARHLAEFREKAK